MVFGMIIGSVLAALAGLLVYVYYLKKGQFEDPETVKFQVFHEDDPEG